MDEDIFLAKTKSTSKSKKEIIKTLSPIATLVLLGLAVHLLLPQIASLEHAINLLKNMIWWAVGLALLAQVLSYVGTGYLLRATARAGGGDLKILTGAAIALASADFGMLAGGMVGCLRPRKHPALFWWGAFFWRELQR